MALRYLIACLLVISDRPLLAQVAGNVVFGAPRAQGTGATTSDLSGTEPKGSRQVAFLEANILLNLKADAYQAVFALAQEGQTVPTADEKLTKQAGEFIASLEALGVKRTDIFVDFISQNRVYDINLENNVARETLAGFEVKKNIVVRYRDAALPDKMLNAAAKSAIFDLVKVDYIINDLPAARTRLLEEAAKVIKQKELSYDRLLGIKPGRRAVDEERYSSYFPSDMYRSYTAYEAANADGYNTRVVRSRKVSTSYYTPVEAAGFDAIINPIGVAPVVQLTLYLKVRYR